MHAVGGSLMVHTNTRISAAVFVSPRLLRVPLIGLMRKLPSIASTAVISIQTVDSRVFF